MKLTFARVNRATASSRTLVSTAAWRSPLSTPAETAKAVAAAGLTDLQSVEGVSAATAKKIYDHFHSEG